MSRLLVGTVLLLNASAAVCMAQDNPDDRFGSVVSFVDQHSPLIVLSRGEASVAVWPAMQGRVLTSSAEGSQGRGFGWVNHQLIASGKVQQHINAVGGEDRLWLGPEGGQYSIFFAPGAPFDLAHWYAPPALDTESFDLVSKSASSASFRKRIELTNYSGTRFTIQIDRVVRLLTRTEISNHLGIELPKGIKTVGYESENTLTNVSDVPMKKATGVLSLWVLGQFQAAPKATIILPIRQGSGARLGPPVKTDYFGPVPADRISIRPGAVLFKADANHRSKLGVSPQRSKGVIGSYDPEHRALTIVQFNQDPTAPYVNSSWQIQKEPYRGDVANCYNDGVPAPGEPQLGRFYELESSSPAEALAPQASVEHTQRTIHLLGSEAQLEPIAEKVLGLSLSAVKMFENASASDASGLSKD